MFVAGVHRSGTSMLARCLGQHPLVSGFSGTGVPEDEGQHLQTVYPPALAFGGPGVFAFAPEAHLTESSSLVSAANRERLIEQWSKHWDMGKPVLLEKSPPNLIRLRFLQALFPEAYFVVILRHPVPVTYSTTKAQPKAWLQRLVRHWVVAHEIYREDRPHVTRLHEIRYEDLVTSPDGVLSGVYDFLGLEPIATRFDVRSDSSEPYFERWRGEERSLQGRIAHFLMRAELETRVNSFGYSLRVPPSAAAQ